VRAQHGVISISLPTQAAFILYAALGMAGRCWRAYAACAAEDLDQSNQHQHRGEKVFADAGAQISMPSALPA